MSMRDKDAGRRAKKKKRQFDTVDSSLQGNSGEFSSKHVLDEKERAYLAKIELCCTVYNFQVPDSDVEKKEAKTKTLMEILQFVHERDGLIPEAIFAGIVKMFSANIFRNLPPNENSDFDPEEDEQKFDPAWPHLHIVYEIFLRCVEFGHFKIDHGKKYLTEKFVFSFLDMFNAEDPRERDMLKTILHRIYAKIVMIRLYIRKQMNYIFYRYIYEQESFNGIAELLEICGSIINGFNLPLKEEHKDFFRRILLPLLKTNHLSVFHPQLIYCIVQFLEKDPKLTEQAISQMLRYWPKTCSHKEVIFLAGIEEIMDVIEPNQFVKIEVALFQQIAKCIVSPHFQVSERALYFWNNDYLLSLLNQHISSIMPIVFPSVYQAKDHWNKAIVALAYNVLKSFMEMHSEMFDMLIQPYLKKKGDEPDSQSDSEPGNYSSDTKYLVKRLVVALQFKSCLKFTFVTSQPLFTFTVPYVTFSTNSLSIYNYEELDTRIIIGSFSQNVAQSIFCEAYKLGIYGGDYAWVLQGLPANGWWVNSERCGQDMMAAMDGVILVTNYKPRIGTIASISGLSSREFEAQMEGRVSGYAYETYDALWAITLSLVSTLRSVNIVNFDYKNKDFTNHLSTNMASLSFNGVSGPVAFDGPDRVGFSAFYQVQSGTAVMIAVYDPYRSHLDMMCAECNEPIWPGGQAPTAKRFFKLRTETVQPIAFVGIAIVASFGICLAIIFLATNLHFRRHKYIKLSSPKLNNVAGVGCVLVYTAVILLGMDSATLPSTKIFPTICTARVYLLSAGFSMAFGSMFAKTYRVHRIFTRNARGVKNKLLQDTQLISLICVLLVVDGLIVTLWVTFDPIERQLKNLSLEMSPLERSIVYQPQIEVCSSIFIHNWLGALYVYKGLMLTVGVYMAWETRHVKIPALNDSQYIGLSVYSVVITSVLVVVLANLVSERVTLAFLCISLPILISTTGSLCLLFVPKIYEIFVNKDNPERLDPIMQSMGLKIECNTRRFLTDDRRELYFRVEVQNKVYRRELHLLDGEISKLEKQLSHEEGSSASSHSSVLPKNDIEEGLEKLPFRVPPRGKSTSVSGGIPVLLLSVLPPVIPRASWPSEERSGQNFRRGVAFNSEPELDEKKSLSDTFASRQTNVAVFGPPNKMSMFGKLLSMIYPGQQSARKSSAPAGFVSAFKAHVEYFASSIPGNKSASGSGESSNNTSRSWGVNKVPFILTDDLGLQGRESCSLGGLGREHLSDGEDELDGRGSRRVQARSAQSLSHPTVSFVLNHQKQRSQPTLSSCNNRHPKGSPRFPHKISPTVSLEAFEERYFNMKRHTFLNAIRQEPDGRDADLPQSPVGSLEEMVVNIKPLTPELDTSSPH